MAWVSPAPKDDEEARLSVYDILLGHTTITDALLPTEIDTLKLVPSSKNLIGATIELISLEGREFKLREALAPIRTDYPFILLDCPPALDLLTLNALVASDGLLVPMQAEYFALEGISELMSTLDRVTQAFNPALALEGVLLTMFDDRTNLSQQVSDNLKAFFTDKLLKTTIPRNIRLAEAPSHGKPVSLYDPKSRGAEAYRELALELLDRNNMESPEAKRRKAAAAAAASSLKIASGPREEKRPILVFFQIAFLAHSSKQKVLDMPTAVHDPKRRALGKGLESLLPSRPAPATLPTVTAAVEPAGKPLEIPLDHIERNPFQTRTRFDEAQLTELTQCHRGLRSCATHSGSGTQLP